MSCCHGSKISGSQQTEVLQIWHKNDIYTVFPRCMIVLRSKTVAHTFFPSFENANGHLYQEPEILLPW